MGNNVRNIMDIPCGGFAPEEFHGIIHHLMLNVTSSLSKDPVRRMERGLKPLTKDVSRQLMRESADYTTSIQHYAANVLPGYRADAIQNNLELRVNYLTKAITEEEFKSALSRDAKQFNKRNEIGQVIQTVIYGMSDILTRLIQFLRNTNDEELGTNYCEPDEIFKYFREVDALIDYANECLDFICKQYKLTRVAIFIRNGETNQRHYGLYTVREVLQATPEGEPLRVIHPVRVMH
jgi:hypothetical protein